MRSFTVKELADLAGGRVVGDGAHVINGAAPIETAGPQDLSFISNPRYRKFLADSQAGGVVVSSETESSRHNLIVTANPYLTFARLLTYMNQAPHRPLGIMAGAYVAPEVKLGREVTVYPSAFVGEKATLGDRVTLYPGVFVGENAEIGDDTVLYPNVTVYHGCRVGKRVIVHSGAVIGGDGFGFAPNGEKYYKIPQLGIVAIGDDVEIGAGTTIDRAALGRTIIGNGTKIDNLVQIGHNVEIGENSCIVSQVGISGSAKLGRHVVVAGQAGLGGHINIGDYTVIAARGGANHDLAGGQVYSGVPAVPHKLWLKYTAIFKHLPEMRQQLRGLAVRLEALEALWKKEKA